MQRKLILRNGSYLKGEERQLKPLKWVKCSKTQHCPYPWGRLSLSASFPAARMEQMGRAPGNKEARVCKKQMPASLLQSSKEETAPGVGMERKASCSTRSRDPAAWPWERQVIDEGAPSVSIGDIQGMNRVPLSHSTADPRAEERAGGKDRECMWAAKMPCHRWASRQDWALPWPGGPWRMFMPPPISRLHLTPVSPGPFFLSISPLWLLTGIPIANSQSKHQASVAVHSNPCESEPPPSPSEGDTQPAWLTQPTTDEPGPGRPESADSGLQALVSNPAGCSGGGGGGGVRRWELHATLPLSKQEGPRPGWAQLPAPAPHPYASEHWLSLYLLSWSNIKGFPYGSGG